MGLAGPLEAERIQKSWGDGAGFSESKGCSLRMGGNPTGREEGFLCLGTGKWDKEGAWSHTQSPI